MNAVKIADHFMMAPKQIYCLEHKRRRRGRPPGAVSSKYDVLISAALQLFLKDTYQKVTVRKIAALAGVDVALVSYYFGNKEGLYQSMIRDVYATVLKRLRHIQQNPSPTSISELCRISSSLNVEMPGIHQLIFDTLMFKSGPSKEFIKTDIIHLLHRNVSKIFIRLQDNGLIDISLDPELLVDAWVGLCIRPFQTRRMLVDRMDREQVDPYINRLVLQNAALFEKSVAKTF